MRFLLVVPRLPLVPSLVPSRRATTLQICLELLQSVLVCLDEIHVFQGEHDEKHHSGYGRANYCKNPLRLTITLIDGLPRLLAGGILHGSLERPKDGLGLWLSALRQVCSKLLR